MFTADRTRKGGNMSDENGKVVSDLYAAFAQGDVPTVLAGFADVHVWDLEGGKIKRLRQFIDTVKFAEVVPSANSVAW